MTVDGRIMKRVLPNSAKVGKDSKEGIQECVSEFISFITRYVYFTHTLPVLCLHVGYNDGLYVSEASDKCQQEKRKTINGDDILWAMSTLGFDKYVEPLKIYLAKYREAAKNEKPLSTKKMNQRRELENSIMKVKSDAAGGVLQTPVSGIAMSGQSSSLHSAAQHLALLQLPLHSTSNTHTMLSNSSSSSSSNNNYASHAQQIQSKIVLPSVSTIAGTRSTSNGGLFPDSPFLSKESSSASVTSTANNALAVATAKMNPVASTASNSSTTPSASSASSTAKMMLPPPMSSVGKKRTGDLLVKQEKKY